MNKKITPRRLVIAALNRTAGKMRSIARQLEDPALRALVKRGMPRDCYDALSKGWLRAMGFRTVLDVGANTGQFGAGVHAILPDAAIYSFEPLPDCYQQLVKTMAGIEKFRAFNVGLGSTSAEMQFNRSSYAPSSSFRKMATLHKENYPWTAGGESVKVNVRTLDSIAATLELMDPILLKIDVQGYEDQVIAGGQGTCGRAAAIIVEVGFEVLYEGQPLFDDIYRKLTGLGLIFKGALEQTAERKTGRNLYADAIFIRPAVDSVSRT